MAQPLAMDWKGRWQIRSPHDWSHAPGTFSVLTLIHPAVSVQRPDHYQYLCHHIVTGHGLCQI